MAEEVMKKITLVFSGFRFADEEQKSIQDLWKRDKAQRLLRLIPNLGTGKIIEGYHRKTDRYTTFG
jgi:hypothetical protein